MSAGASVNRPLRVVAPLARLDALGGVERCLLEDCTALAQRGHTFAVPYSVDGALRGGFERAGADLAGPHPFDLETRRPLRTLAGYAPGVRWTRAQHADLVWVNRAEHLVWGQLAARWAGVPLVASLHALPMFRRVRLLSTGLAHAVAVSDFVRDAWVEAGMPAERVSVVRNAVPPSTYPVGGPRERSEQRRRLGLPLDAPVVLCYGRLEPGKGTGVLLSAWQQVLAQRPDAVLLLVGDPPSGAHPAIEEALAVLPPSSVVRLPATTEVVPHLHASDVVAFPTTLPETFGRVVVEAMGTGRPVVASRVGALPEVLGELADRWLVEPGSADELAARLLGALGWPSDDPGLGAACAAWAASAHPFEAHVDALEDVLVAHRRRERAVR